MARLVLLSALAILVLAAPPSPSPVGVASPAAQASPAVREIRTVPDLLALARDERVREALASVETPSLADPAGGPFEPIDPSHIQRLRLRGTWRSRQATASADIYVWTIDGRVQTAVERSALDSGLESVAALARSTDVRASGGSVESIELVNPEGTRLEALLRVAFRKNDHPFRYPLRVPLPLGVGAEARVAAAILGAAMAVDATIADPTARFVLATREKLRGTDSAIVPVGRRGSAYTIELFWDSPLGSGATLRMGGAYTLVDPRVGRGVFADLTLPLEEALTSPVAEVKALGNEPSFRWLCSKRNRMGHVYVERAQGRSTIKVYSGEGHWAAYSIGDRVELVGSKLADGFVHPADRQDPDETRALAFLTDGARIEDEAGARTLLAAHPDNLVLLVSLAENAAARNDAREVQRFTDLAHDSLRRIEKEWGRVLRSTADGSQPEALAAMRRMLVLCPVDPRLWWITRCLEASVGRVRPANWPEPLEGWNRAGYGLVEGEKALVPRLKRLGAALGAPWTTATPAPAPPAPGDAAVAVQKAFGPEWEVVALDRASFQPLIDLVNGPGASGAQSLAVLRRRVGPAPLLVAVDARCAPCPSAGIGSRIAERLATLRIGATRLARPEKREVDLVFVKVGPAELLPDPWAIRPPRVPPGLLGGLGSSVEAVLSSAFRRDVWVVGFRLARDSRDVAAGELAGLWAYPLDLGVITRMTIPPGHLGRGDLQTFLATRLIRPMASLPDGAAVVVEGDHVNVLGPGSDHRGMEELWRTLRRGERDLIASDRLSIADTTVAAAGHFVHVAPLPRRPRR